MIYGIYRNRWHWWMPWQTADWHRPRVFTGSDENCNLSVAFVVPPLGTLVIFWQPRRLRTDRDGMCDECVREGWRH
jgi:hypothetical protein